MKYGIYAPYWTHEWTSDYEYFIPKVKKLGFDCFAVCENLKRITLPEGLLEIERGVFFNCFALEKITIPASVIDIHEFAFFHCKSLKNVYMHCTEPPIVSRIFMDNHPEMIIHVPAESVNAYLNAEHWREQNIVGDL